MDYVQYTFDDGDKLLIVFIQDSEGFPGIGLDPETSDLVNLERSRIKFFTQAGGFHMGPNFKQRTA